MEIGYNSSPKEVALRRVEYENNRFGVENEKDGYDCELCRNKGYTVFAKEYNGSWQESQKQCSCMEIRRNLRNLMSSGLGDFVKDFSLERFETQKPFQKAMLEKAKKYLENGGNSWFALFGQSGCGKTMLCSAIAIELAKRGNSMKYFLWREESRAIKKDNREDGELIQRYKEIDVLYIDDMFKCGKDDGSSYQKPTQADINIAFELINARMLAKKITIISSENTIDELFSIDASVAGRIKQMCGDFMLNISKGEGKNYRKENF